jgi:sigma-E factor negative regulatory protein RseB
VKNPPGSLATLNSARFGRRLLSSAFGAGIGALLALSTGSVYAQAPAVGPTSSAASAPDSQLPERGVSEWLVRMHEGSRKRTYVGTFVVSSSNSMSSSRIWHACDGQQQMERVEALTGAPRSTIRRNDEIITFHVDSKVALSEKREFSGVFPGLLKSNQAGLAQLYSARQLGVDRVAGIEADVVLLQPKDKLRFGYRVWSERKGGLVIKLQTLDTDGRVLEQAAYSELQLDAPVSMSKLTQMMGNLDGYRLVKSDLQKTTALAEGWQLKSLLPGYKPMNCYKRMVAKADGANTDSAMQWTFSDGLASVSVFVEAFDRARHIQEGQAATGATHSITRRFVDRQTEQAGDWWLTVVGEVPVPVLLGFAQSLERRK